MTKKTNISKAEMIEILQEKYGRKDLGFGCEVETDEHGKVVLGHFNSAGGGFTIEDENELAEEGQIKKTLGHPLTLSDVLKAIWRNMGTFAYEFVHPDIKGGIVLDDRLIQIILSWDLSKNLLRDQSEKTIRAVYEILIP